MFIFGDDEYVCLSNRHDHAVDLYKEEPTPWREAVVRFECAQLAAKLGDSWLAETSAKVGLSVLEGDHA